jgi:hypothetical protein
MAKTISIIAHRQDADFVQALANSLHGRSYDIYAGPQNISTFPRYMSTHQHVQRGNDSNVLIMSRDMWTDNRDIIKIFVEKIINGWENLQIISMDDQWPYIDDEAIKSLKGISFLNAHRTDSSPQTGQQFAEKIVDAIRQRLSMRSHFTSEHFVSLLREMFGACQVIEEKEDRSLGINLTLCKCFHPSSGQPEIYVGVHPGATLENCRDYLKANWPKEMSGESQIYVVRSDPGAGISRRQSELTSELFGGQTLQFESMVGNRKFNYATRDLDIESDDFVIPQQWHVEHSDEDRLISSQQMVDICSGRNTDFDSRIIILNGTGGAGKTHFVREMYRRLRADGKDVFFLTAEAVRQADPDLTISTLYDIYKASNGGADVLRRDIFDLKFHVEEVLLIVDGLEEIITQLGERFRLNDFYADCRRKAESMANGRIAITIREQTWPPEIDSYAVRFGIELFSISQAEEYFKAEFQSDPERAQLALQIYNQMNSTKDNWPPLYCKLIATDVDRAEDIDEYRLQLDRGEFSSISNINVLIEGIIKRDKKHGVDWPPKRTLEALGQVAAESVAGPVNIETVTDILAGAFEGYQPDNLEVAVKNFVLFRYRPQTNSIDFRFDFVVTTLLAHYILGVIKSIDSSAIHRPAGQTLFARRLVPGSDVSNCIIQESIADTSGDFFTILDELIRDVNTSLADAHPGYLYRLISSNLLFIRLHMDSTLSIIDDYTSVMKEIFAFHGSENHIYGLSLIRFSLGGPNTKKIRFNIEGLDLSFCWFEDCEVDAVLVANANTTFSRTTFRRSLRERPPKKLGLWEAQILPDCWTDDQFDNARASVGQELTVTDARCEEALIRFFRCFAVGNGHAFTRRRKRDSLQGILSLQTGFGVDDVIKAFNDHGLIELVAEATGEQYELTKIGRKCARDLVIESLQSAKVRDVIHKLVR